MLTSAVQGRVCLIRWPATLPGRTLQQDQPPADRPRLSAPEEISERCWHFCFYCIGEKLPGCELLCALDQRKIFEMCLIWADVPMVLSLYLAVQRWRYFLHFDLGVLMDDRSEQFDLHLSQYYPRS